MQIYIYIYFLFYTYVTQRYFTTYRYRFWSLNKKEFRELIYIFTYYGSHLFGIQTFLIYLETFFIIMSMHTNIRHCICKLWFKLKICSKITKIQLLQTSIIIFKMKFIHIILHSQAKLPFYVIGNTEWLIWEIRIAVTVTALSI